MPYKMLHLAILQYVLQILRKNYKETGIYTVSMRMLMIILQNIGTSLTQLLDFIGCPIWTCNKDHLFDVYRLHMHHH